MEVTIIKKHPIPKKTAVIIVLISILIIMTNWGINGFKNSGAFF